MGSKAVCAHFVAPLFRFLRPAPRFGAEISKHELEIVGTDLFLNGFQRDFPYGTTIDAIRSRGGCVAMRVSSVGPSQHIRLGLRGSPRMLRVIEECRRLAPAGSAHR